MDSTARRHRPAALTVATALLALAAVAAQWNIDGNRRIDYRIYSRAVSSIGDAGLYGYGTGILRFTYPPVAALVIWPFTWLDEAVGSRLWLIASVVAFVAAGALALRHAGGRVPVPTALAALGGAATLWLAPAISTLRLGQINAFVALLLCLDVAAMSRRSRWAGIGVGLAAAVKVTPVLVIAMLWAGSPHDRAVARRAAFTLAAVTAVGALVAPGATWEFVGKLGGRAVERAASTSVDLRVLLRSVVGSRPVADGLWLLAAALLLVAALATARRLARRTAGPAPIDGVGLVTVGMCLSTVVSPFSSVHHLTFASIAVALWALRATRPWHRVVAVGGLVAMLDPTAGEAAAGRWAMVAFCVATVIALPRAGTAPDFAEDGEIPQDVVLLRGGH